MWSIVFTVSVYAAECEQAVSSQQLEQQLGVAEEHFQNLEEEEFHQEVVALGAFLLPCMSEKITEEAADRYHRLMAIHLYSLGEEQGALSSVISLAAHRDADFLASLTGPDHPLVASFASVETPRSANVPEPRDGFVGFDGRTGRSRPKNAPTIAQRLGPTGIPNWTKYLGKGEGLPDYSAIPRNRNRLLGCAIASGAAGLGLYGWSLGTKTKLRKTALDQSVSAETLNGLRGQSSGLQIGSLALLGVGGGCSIGALLVGER